MSAAAGGRADEFPARDYLTGDAFTVRRATEGWWATVPVPADLSRYYPPAYYGERRRRVPGSVEWLQGWLYRRRARWITRRAGRPGRVLDVGCGPGHLLACFRAEGWSAIGTEATPAAAAIPRERHGLEVAAGELNALALPGVSFDAVVSWHTLEHMRDPGAALDEMVRVLKPGGLLLVSVPDFSSVEAQAQPAAWFHLDVPRHLVHFPAEVLRGLLRARGLVVLEEHRTTPEYDAFSLLQTWQNRFGLPHNLLYLLLKSARRRGAQAGTALQVGAAILLAVLLAGPALVLAAWRGWSQRGAVMVVLARKG